MKKAKGLSLALTLLLLNPTNPVYAAPNDEDELPLYEVFEIYYLLQENHLSKPSEKQLVQGALTGVSAKVKEVKNVTLEVPETDDTLEELSNRLTEWKEAQKLDYKKMGTWAVDGMVKTLNDPFTDYYDNRDIKQFQNAIDDEYVGFGIRFRLYDGNIMVKEIVDKSPASRADIKPGDYLMNADGESMMGKTLEEAYEYLAGTIGTSSTLTMYRPSTKQIKKLTMTRMPLEVREATGARFVGSNIGYIKLDTFGDDAGQQFMEEMNKLEQSKQPIKGLVVDLRDNGGGYLHAAYDIASLFMEDGLLMYTTDRNKVEVETWIHNGRPVNYPVRILVNEGTASASELLSGALLDNGIAKLVGSHTYGKGIAQVTIPAGSGGLKITVNQYFTPKHIVVQKVGLEPEIKAADDVAQVIRALSSLGTKQYTISQAVIDEVTINGVKFPLIEPLFKSDAKGIYIRTATLATLSGKSDEKLTGYTLLTKTNTPANVTVTKVKNTYTLTYKQQ
ncbi:S41 family peptidase [Brevibacillus dissolubilis]|uniref:S41 family peptidase n=1 Tax=Brevibacillus dissolubilis TaxID=1844116 RepID=UPI001115D790|nr:S41 family peptidase [Brevibacillus dissolubilis]